MVNTDEIKINKDEEVYDLETLITEGADAQIPIEIEFPNGKKAAAKIRPITTAEFQSIYSNNTAEILLNVLELGLLNKNGEPLPHKLLESMPMGITAKIAEKLCAISGLELQPENKISANDIMKQTELFP